MSPLMHFKLKNGRSIIVANAVSLDGDRLLADGSTLILISESRTECLALSAVSECELLDARDPVPADASIYAFAGVTHEAAY